MRPTRFAVSPLAVLLVSVALHALVGGPVVADWEPRASAPVLEHDHDHEEGEPHDGELPIEELENGPFRVSLYTEPPPAAPPAAEPPAAVPAVAKAAPRAVAKAAPRVAPTAAEAAPAEPGPDPVVAEAPAEPELSEADKAALAAMERGEGEPVPTDEDDDGVAQEAGNADGTALAEAQKPRSMRRARARTSRERRPPCPLPDEDIARVAERHWYIDRDLIERYATNIPELQKLGSVWTHRGADGKLDGFRVGLARCSVLKHGGLRSGDIVHDINGRRINTVLQAVGAYLALRNEPELRLNITRRGEPMVLAYTVEQPERKRGKKHKKKTATASR